MKIFLFSLFPLFLFSWFYKKKNCLPKIFLFFCYWYCLLVALEKQKSSNRCVFIIRCDVYWWKVFLKIFLFYSNRWRKMENKLYASHTFFATFLNLRFHIFTFIFSYYAFSFHPSHHPNRTFTIFIFSTLFCVYLLLLLLCVRRAKEKQINVYIFILFSLISHSPARFQKKNEALAYLGRDFHNCWFNCPRSM